MKDLTGKTLGFIFNFKDEMRPSLDKLSATWKQFGKSFEKHKKTISKGFGLLSKDSKELEKDVKRLTVLEFAKSFGEGIRNLQDFRLDGVSDEIEGFAKNTADMQKMLGWTREGLLSFRRDARAATEELGRGVLDINLFSEALEAGAQAGVKNRETLIGLGKTAAMVTELVGGSSDELVKTMWKLRDSAGLSQGSVDNLVANMVELRKEQHGINVNFEGLLETVQATSSSLEMGFRGFGEQAKRNVVNNLVAIQSSFESAFGEDASSMINDMMDQVSKGEGAFVQLLGGVEESKKVLAEGDPTKILEAMQRRISGVESTLGLAKMAESMGMTEANVVKLKDKFADLVTVGDKAFQVMQGGARDTSSLSEEVEAATTWFTRAQKAIQAWVGFNPVITEMTDALEGIGPVTQTLYSGFGLLGQTKGFLKGTAQAVWGLGKGLVKTTVKAGAFGASLLLQVIPALISGVFQAGAFGVSLLTSLIPGLSGATAGAWAFTAALLANPITWIVVGIMALIAGLVLLVKNWDTVTDAVGRFFSYLWEKITWATSALGDFVGAIFGGIGGAVEGAVGWLSGAFDSIVGILSTPIEWMKGFINDWVLRPLNWVLTYDLPLVGPLGDLIGIGEIPQLAAGAIVTGPTVAEIGEGGEPEVVFPLSELEKFIQNPPPNVQIENRFDEVVTEIRKLKDALLSVVASRPTGMKNPSALKVTNWGYES